MASEEGQPLVQVPRHEFRVVDDGTKETVEITVQLPGVVSASEISVRIEPPQTVTVSVPNRYHLQLRLAMPIAQRAESVRFRTKTARLNMSCRVLTPDEIKEQAAAATAAAAEAAGAEDEPAAAAGVAGSSSSSSSSATPQLVTASSSSIRGGSTGAAAAVATAASSSGSNAGSSSGGRQQQQQQQDPSAVLESFLPPPTKAERKRMQQEDQRRKEAEEKRRREAEAAAAAAAEAERQRQAEAAAAARRAAEEERRQEAARKAAAKAAAAEEQQRREQQRRLNKAAAEEWLSRGHAAITEDNIETASKALNKAKELDPNNKEGIQKLTKELSALRQKAAAAGSRRGSSPAADGSSGHEPPRGQDSGSNGWQQQQQWSYWQRRQQARHGVKDDGVRDILDKWSAGGHARNIVGWWCSFVDFLCYWVTWAAAVSVEWAGGIPSSKVRGGRAGRAFLWCVTTAGNILMFVPPLSMVAWQLAWQKPLSVVAYVRRVGGDSHLEAAEWMMDCQYWLSEREDIGSAITKAVLASSTGGTVYAAVWGTCFLSIGPHSLLGWLWALVGWVWRILLWDPSYALQVAAAGVGTGFCSVQRPGPCWITLYPLQVLLSNRGWGTLLTLGGSFLYSNVVKDWRPSWRQYRAPWWQAVLVTVVPVLVTRSISRVGIWWLFLWPVSLLGGLGWKLLKAVGWPVGIVVQVAGSVLQVPTSGVSAALSTPAGRLVSKALLAITRPVAYSVGWVVKLTATASRVVLPGCVLKQAGHVFCSWNQSLFGHLCKSFTAAATAKLAQSKLRPAFPHAWWWDAGLFVWLFYVTAIITAWEEEFGKDYYRQQQQKQQQQRQQQQQQRPRRAPGSDDEAEHNSLGDKQSDFPMGFGAVAVPAGCEVVSVKAVLEAKDYYMVMGYSSREEVNPESLKTKRRQLVLAVHPDKVGHDYPGANLAAGRVNKAYETLSDPAMRSAYDSILANHTRGRAGRSAAAGAAGGSSNSSGAWVEEYSDELYERPPAEDKFMCQDMGCPGCGGFHTTYILPKAPFGVRWCAECKDWHPVGKGEVWAHWTPGPMGMSWLGGARLLLCADPDGPTYDVTEVFRCKEAGGILPKHKAMCNTHINPFLAASRGFSSGGCRGGGGGGGSSTARRSRKKGRRNR